MKQIKYILPLALLSMMAFTITSCDDMLNMGNDDVLYADENHLTQGTDTVNSYVGILSQLQKIAVRTNLYGELRGDLVVVNENANADLKDIASFTVSDDNAYNNPRDYYAVINNCNYYLANADTALRERRYDATTLSAYDFRVFQAEYCAVRAIRAWIYLQLGQIYGTNIPLVVDPVLSLDDANTVLSNAPKRNLEQLCDYFIDDLKPYVSWFAYPYHHNVYGYSMPARMAVFPVSLVLGDLYLWSASIKHDTGLAREAAKSYYDYIAWLPSELGVDNNSGYKQKTVTSSDRTYWDQKSFTSSNFTSTVIGNAYWRTTHFGEKGDEVITAIAMDSLASDENYNELRVLYNYDLENENKEASISPSTTCNEYSDNQAYAERYYDGNDYVMGYVSAGLLQETQVAQHYVGDLRLAANLSRSRRGDHDFESQMIYKTYLPQDIIIYRIGDVYLRMAEALNLAGFPKFALAILTTGLDNTVIGHDVLSQCTSAADSSFVNYFDFPLRYFQTRVQSYKSNGEPNVNSDENDTQVNQIGIHARGSGYAIANPRYYDPANDAPTDSTGYPVQPVEYIPLAAYSSNFEGDLQTILDNNPELTALAASEGDIPVINLNDYTGTVAKMEAVKKYNEQLIAFSSILQDNWRQATVEWYRTYGVPQVFNRQLEVVDSLLDVESALETPFEGFRFGQLIRAAYRSNDRGAYMSKKVARRDPALAGRLSNPANWFISWKGVIGQ